MAGTLRIRVPARRPAATLEGLRRHWALVAKPLLLVVLLLLPLVGRGGVGSSHALAVMSQAGLYAILTMAVGVLLGQAGQLSFGHSAFYGIGAYTCGLLVFKLHANPLLAWAAGAAAAGFVAFIVGRPALKHRYFHLALVTLGLAQVFPILVYEWKWAGASSGFRAATSLDLFGFAVNTQTRTYYLIWGTAIILLLLLSRLLKYRVGRAFRGIAADQTVSATLGVRLPNWKLRALVLNALLCGVAGGLFVFLYQAVRPQDFAFAAWVLPILMMVVAGGRSIWGGVVGAIVITVLFNGFYPGQPRYDGTIYSVLLILAMLVLPAGILGLRTETGRHLWALLKSGRLRHTAVAVAPAALAVSVAVAPAASADLAAGPGSAPGPGRAPAVDQPVAAQTPAAAPAAPAVAVAPVVPAAQLRAPRLGGQLGEDLAAQKYQMREATLLRVLEVTVRFGSLKAVDDLSFVVKEGSITGLVGPNGAGKTTVLDAIGGLQAMASGHLWFGDIQLTGLPPYDRARQGLARTFQDPRLLAGMTVLENVLAGCHQQERSGFWSGGLGLPTQRSEEKRSRHRAFDALEFVGLRADAMRPASGLPHGRRRLVELGRALASRPKLLLLDEPAAGLDPSERDHLASLIRGIRDAGVTVLVAEEDAALAKSFCDEVIRLDRGRLVARAPFVRVRPEEGEIPAWARREGGQGQVSPREGLLVLDGVTAGYGSVPVLHDVSLSIGDGATVAVLGGNGAGKSTLLRTISGLVQPLQGRVHFQGADITGMAPEKIVTAGIGHVPQGRQLFSNLGVEDNLIVGATGRKSRGGLGDDLDRIYELFPTLAQRRKHQAGTLPLAEQQMLAIGRALAGRPTLLLLDEPSLGLAPPAVERIFAALAKLNQEGLTIVVADQNAEMALLLTRDVVMLQAGRVHPG
jgi:ABC-type branched-subunit amino acid transport system ATPase component/ABC-type branched-subunit amino acid transport system permease subunit